MYIESKSNLVEIDKFINCKTKEEIDKVFDSELNKNNIKPIDYLAILKFFENRDSYIKKIGKEKVNMNETLCPKKLEKLYLYPNRKIKLFRRIFNFIKYKKEKGDSN